MSQSFRQQALLVVIATLVFFVNLGAIRLWDVDEAIFSQAAVEMYERGDYVVPYFNGELFPDKPALTYWCMIIAYKLFGVNEFAARFWSAVFGVGTVLLTYQIGRRLFSSAVGLWAGLILATNLNFGIIARAATPDSLLTFFTTLAVLLFVSRTIRRRETGDGSSARTALEFTPPSWSTYALVYAAMGAAVLVKGPVGVVLPTAVLGLFLLATQGPNALDRLPAESSGGRLRWLRSGLDAMVRWFAPGHFVRTVFRMRPITALAMVLLVAGPWYVWVGLRTDWQWPSQFFGVHNFGRFLNAMDNHRGPIVYYLGVILVLFFPWSIVIGGSVYELVRQSARSSVSRLGAMLVVCWLAVYLGFFSLASTKLPNYIIPLYPALALATGMFLERWTSAPASVPRWWLGLSFSILTIAGVAMLVALPMAAELLTQPDWSIGLVGLVPLLGGIVGLYLVYSQQLVRAAKSLGVTAVALVVWLFGLTAVEADRFQTAQDFTSAISEHTSGSAQVASFEYFRPTMVYYGHCPVATLTRPTDVADFFRNHPQDAFLYTLDEKLPKLSGAFPPDVVVLQEHRRLFKTGKVLLFGRKSEDVARQIETNTPRR